MATKYRLVVGEKRGEHFILPDDFRLYDMESKQSRQLLALVEVTEVETGQDCTGIVIENTKGPSMVIVAIPEHLVRFGCDIEAEDVLDEIPARYEPAESAKQPNIIGRVKQLLGK